MEERWTTSCIMTCNKNGWTNFLPFGRLDGPFICDWPIKMASFGMQRHDMCANDYELRQMIEWMNEWVRENRHLNECGMLFNMYEQRHFKMFGF